MKEPFKTYINLNSSVIQNDYAFNGNCTLLNYEYVSTTNTYRMYNTLKLGNEETGRTSYDNWNLGNDNLDSVLFTNLDDYPIWSEQWTAPSI